jgi:hypothetical protein
MSEKQRKTMRDEYFDPGCEYFDPGREFSGGSALFPVGSAMRDPQEELFDPGKEFFETEQGSVRHGKKGKKRSKNTMTVLIAAVVAAVGISSTGAAVPDETEQLPPEPTAEIAVPAPTSAVTPEPKPSLQPDPSADDSFLDGRFEDISLLVSAESHTSAAFAGADTRTVTEKTAEP